ncbi:E3 ubiquitin-protein ligase TRIM39-like [Amblyraja radiata]|uniref:E3 ubiquitin-protein ligase TRIM39-like n=1 Tax=Amblyraja radiata TaxID=386614 RepID=UPI0014028DAC|nr:E3 ubiquitin-protein ligase TRIM39-like [Amblyraja radiata]
MDTPVPASDCAVCRSPGLGASARRLPCGHRLCSDCARYSDTALGGSLDCPTCSGPVTAPLPALDVATAAAGGRAERLCPQHGQPLQLFCQQDGQCVCTSCMDSGSHREHTVTSLDTARDSLKEKLKKEVENLRIIQQDCHFKHQDMTISESDIKTQIDQLKRNLTKKFTEWRKCLEEDEECALKVIDTEGEKVLVPSRRSGDELIHRMNQIKLIDDETRSLVQQSPLQFIQDSSQLLQKVAEEEKVPTPEVPKLVLNLCSAPEAIKKRLRSSFMYQSAILGTTTQWSSLTLDPDSAYWLLNVSEDEKTVMFGYMGENSWHNSKMFENMHQVLCAQSFTAGCHSWDVRTGGVAWGAGVAYGSIERGGLGSYFTSSPKSWCLYFYRGTLTACHCDQHAYLLEFPATSRVRLQLDYEGGTLAFYQVGEQHRHLHTFHTAFTEPVYPAFSCSGNSSLKLC